MIYPLETSREPQVLAALEAHWHTVAQEELARRLTYLDTFDWRLHRDGGTLAAVPGSRGTSLEWRAFDGELRSRARLDAVPAFTRDLPPGPLRDALAERTEPRCLLPVVEVALEGRQIRLLDSEEKTVVRLFLEGGTVSEPAASAWESPAGKRTASKGTSAPLEPRLRVVAVKGYEDELAQAVSLLEDDLGLARAETDELSTALAALGRRPRSYTSKLEIRLEPETAAGEAIRQILRHLLATLVANEAGARRALDPEFLHDFRVSVRRTRSALSQLPGVLPDAAVERFRRGFSWLGDLTGPTRDLDVYRLQFAGLQSSLPERVRPYLDPLRVFLEEHQATEQRRLARALGSKRYRELIGDWTLFLEAPTPEGKAPPNADLPVREMASERIRRAWRRVLKRGRKVSPTSPPSHLHRLRIACKKLRYLLEFFRGLEDGKDVDRLVQALKKLQDNLGDYNDCEVQQRRLEDFADQMVLEDLAPVPTLLAMGRLLEQLARRQERERRRFAKRFAAFTAPKNRARFQRLFEPPPGTGEEAEEKAREQDAESSGDAGGSPAP